MLVKQRHAKAFLKRADLPADRGLAQIERLAGMGEAARLGDRMKHPQLVPIHRHLLDFRETPPRALARFATPIRRRALPQYPPGRRETSHPPTPPCSPPQPRPTPYATPY